jgi:hypothetical protein
MTQVLKMRSGGYSIDQIRQFMNYTWKVRTRMGGEWTNSRIPFLIQQGLSLGLLPQRNGASSEQPLEDIDNEEEYDNLIELEGESDD